MRAFFRWLRRARFTYQPLISVRISRARLEHNFAQFVRLLGDRAVAPVLKSNAYGHGLIPVAKLFDRLNPPFMVVDSFYEALVLQNEHIRTPVLVLGYTSAHNIARQKFSGVSFALIGIEHVREVVARLTVPQAFHLKIDTGMHRQGILVSQLDETIKLLKRNPNVRITGVCTHLADADGPVPDFTRMQIKVWNRVVERLHAVFPQLSQVHVANSAGTQFATEIRANSARVGLGLYGIDPAAARSLDLKPALQVVTQITAVRTIQPGEHVGYNTTFTATRPTRVATLPIGYFEGLDRRLSGNGSVSVHGKPALIIGRISMNIASIDITDLPEAKAGDPVIVFSQNPSAPNSIAQAAVRCKTIPYDLLVHIAQHLRRTVV
ncbi:MAG: alanine racemase [Candidatus Andersenbacteria bacterium]